MKFRILALIMFISANLAVGQSVWLNGNGIRLRNGDVSAVGAVNGNIYYDIGLNQFRFYENGSWKTLSATAVSSVFGRTGAVTAQSSDYSSFYLPFSLTPGHIFVGNVSSVATDVAMSGDVTLSSAGITTIGSGKVTNSMLAGSIAASKLIGSDISTVGTISSGSYQATPIADAYISSASAWNAKVSSQWTTTGSDIYFANKVRIGSSTAPSYTLHVTETSSGSPRGIVGDQYNNGTNSSQIHLRKARGTEGTPLAITSGDIISNFSSWAHDGTSFINAGSIRLSSVGTIGTGRTPSKMEFMTMTDVTTGVLTVGATLDQLQNFGIGAAPSARLHVQSSGTSTEEVVRVTDATPNTRLSILGNGNTTFTQGAQTSSSPTFLTFTGGAHTALTSGAEATDVNFNLARTVQFTNGALSTQRAFLIQAPTYSFTSASTLSNAVTLDITGSPAAGTNMTITDSYALRTEAGRVLFSSGGGSSTKGNVTISDASSSGKILLDLRKSSSVFSISQEGRVLSSPSAATIGSNIGFIEVTGTNTITSSFASSGDASYFLKLSPSLSAGTGTATEFGYFARFNPSIAFGSTSMPYWMLDINPSTTGTPGSLYGVTVRPTNFNNGFGTGTPNSTLQVAGSIATGYVSKTASYILTSTDGTVEVTSGTNTQTLPTAVGCAGRWYYITNSGSGTVTVATTSSQTFVNISGTPTSMSLTQFQTWAYQSNGTNWLAFKEY
jgi:hypothetical protein